jgi:hypothetical protein
MSEYNSDILEVSSGEFKMAHGQKYQDPTNFLQALWNEAGPTVGSMKIMLKLMRTKFEGEMAGLKADLTNVPPMLINFFIKEAGEDSNNAIDFINQIANQLSKYNKESNAGEDKEGDPTAHPPNKGDKPNKASKTQGTLPRAPEANPARGTATATATMVEGGEKGMQSLSMASGE